MHKVDLSSSSTRCNTARPLPAHRRVLPRPGAEQERDRALYPVEIKAAELARPSDVKAFAALDSFSGYERQPGVVVCNMPAQGSAGGDGSTGSAGSAGSTALLPLPDGNSAIPVTYL